MLILNLAASKNADLHLYITFINTFNSQQFRSSNRQLFCLTNDAKLGSMIPSFSFNCMFASVCRALFTSQEAPEDDSDAGISALKKVGHEYMLKSSCIPYVDVQNKESYYCTCNMSDGFAFVVVFVSV